MSPPSAGARRPSGGIAPRKAAERREHIHIGEVQGRADPEGGFCAAHGRPRMIRDADSARLCAARVEFACRIFIKASSAQLALCAAGCWCCCAAAVGVLNLNQMGRVRGPHKDDAGLSCRRPPWLERQHRCGTMGPVRHGGKYAQGIPRPSWALHWQPRLSGCDFSAPPRPGAPSAPHREKQSAGHRRG